MADEDAAYAYCSFGIGRWYWAVWANEPDARAAAEPVASGYEKTGEAAERKAAESAGPRAKRLPGKWASGFKRGGTARTDEAANRGKPKSRLSRRAAAPTKSDVPARPTFLYAVSESDQAGSHGEVVIVRHRIVRKTPGKIYIDPEPFREESHDREGDVSSPEDPKPRKFAVDRETLEREGRVPHRGAYLYTSEEDGIRDVQAALTSRHGWCAALGVKFPCSAETIKAAYRRLSRENHPDAGGDPAEFLAVAQAYREALAYFSSTDDNAPKPG